MNSVHSIPVPLRVSKSIVLFVGLLLFVCPLAAGAVTFTVQATGLSGTISFANYGDVAPTSYSIIAGSGNWDPADLGGLAAQSWNGNQLICLANTNTWDNAAPGQSLNVLTFTSCGFVSYDNTSGNFPVTFTELIVPPPAVPASRPAGVATLVSLLLLFGLYALRGRSLRSA